MKKPILFLVDDNSAVLNAVACDIKSNYRKEYRTIAPQSATEGLEALKELKNKGETVVLFIFIGARPYTDGIDIDIVRDKRGFVETGNALTHYEEFNKIWKLPRKPHLLETYSPGIFAAGDVRAGAMNWVASAVSEGGMAIKFVHEYLAEN